MEKSSLIPIGLIFGLVWWFMQASPTPTPTPAPNGPDLLSAFKAGVDQARAKQDAKIFADLCGSIADVLEHDANQTTPRIRTGMQVDDLRIATRELRMRGASFSTYYPQLGPTIDAYMQPLGLKAGPLDAPQRAKWIEAFRTLHTAASYAASHL